MAINKTRGICWKCKKKTLPSWTECQKCKRKKTRSPTMIATRKKIQDKYKLIWKTQYMPQEVYDPFILMLDIYKKIDEERVARAWHNRLSLLPKYVADKLLDLI